MSERRVLVVEDEPPLRAMLVWAFRDEGYQVLEAQDGLQAISVLDEQAAPKDAPDVILLDMMLPHLDGLGVLHHVTDHGHHGDAVAVSASSWHRQAASAEGARATIGKPFELEKLLDLVDRCCKKAS
jgi:CheY-like chemotaxis protein